MFDTRLEQSEWIDRPDCPLEVIRDSHRFMRFVNRFFGGTAAVKDFIRYACLRHPPGRPLRILDVGSGSGDIPLEVARWARSKNIDLHITCIERENKAVTRLPRCPDVPISFVNTDIFEYKPMEVFDYAMASMFLHHLQNEQIPGLVRRLLMYTRKGLFINDLHRTFFTWVGGVILCSAVSSRVRHDALVSIRKGFHAGELKTLLSAPGWNINVATRPWGRITALLKLKETP